MSACCVSGCKNRASSGSRLKFYRIPSGYRPFQANRRRLWLQAIQQANGSIEGLKGNVRVCGAHFLSGEASMDHGSTDFVPSVFPKQGPKKRAKWFFGCRKRRRRKVVAEVQASASVENDSELSKDTETPSSPKREKWTKTKTETKVNQPQDMSSLSQTTPTLKIPPGTPELGKMSPIVLLKPVVGPAGGYRCEQCNQTFSGISHLVKHRQQHEEPTLLICEICGQSYTCQTDLSEHQKVHTKEPSFPCNICDRSFTTVHHLKRHKLLHVKDGRKCLKCGVLFCQKHNHILFLPQTVTKVEESDDDSSVTEPHNLDSNLTPNELEPSQVTETGENTQSPETTTPHLPSPNTVATPPTPSNFMPPPPALHTRVLSKMFMPKLTRPPPMLHPPVPQWKYCRTSGVSFSQSPVPDYPASFIQPHLPQHPPLPSSLQLFSPQCLTSALLEVKRNYDYILNKKNAGKWLKAVKEEQAEPVRISPHMPRIKEEKDLRIAYDIEIVI
ncbi:zinc finger protein 93-like [Parambassis ranga]|uniref:Zinc finger protein 93-like n=1 Tax=Parambassis ranga TaxID=210632 RepID=A0A6P7I8Y7_9TELE|nr:zinc finger protein 93-like [Parambassis ranga]